MSLFSLHKSPRLLVTVLVALFQGAWLWWLDLAIDGERWPAGSGHWLLALYACAFFVPLTLQLMSEYWRSALLWWVAGAMAGLLLFFGWHHGARIVTAPMGDAASWEGSITLLFVVAVLWLHFLPFLLRRLVTGRWRGDYERLFAAAWRQAIMLAEAALFSGLFWALLLLWARLFKMLGYGFFDWLFTGAAFAYPFTTVVFGVALYLTGSLEKLVTVVREQLLGLLKWLAPVAGLILALFAPALLFKLPELISQGERAIGAGWLLWLLAFTVLLLNAGYQNGRIETPYPRLIGLFLRIVLPATVLVAAVAVYGLAIRIGEYGLTVERVFAMLVALVAMGYAIGYSLAAVRRGPWLQGIERINVGVAIGLMLALGAMLTPLASPYRLSAASQYQRAIAQEGEARLSALQSLRFDTGRYGRRALERLVSRPGEGEAVQEIRRQAKAMLEREDRWPVGALTDPDTAFAQLRVFPAGRQLDPDLLEALKSDYRSALWGPRGDGRGMMPLAVMIDLNDDSKEECVIVTYPYYTLYARGEAGWALAGARPPAPLLAIPASLDELEHALAAGNFSALPGQWQDLRIGRHRLHMNAALPAVVAPQ